jgi:hypothetical protein
MIPASGSAAITLADLASVGTDAPAVQVITFDDGSIPAEFAWSAFGPGIVIDRVDVDGGTTKALRYPDIDDSEESYFEIFADARPGNNVLTVRYEVSSESGYDYWRIYIDDVQVWQEAGTGAGWSEYSTTLAVGVRRIKFRYSKDSSADDGDDTAYISKITVSPIGERPITVATTLAPLTSSASGETEIYPGYRFWRITMEATASLSGTAGGIAECELRGSFGGADLTDSLPGTASMYLGSLNPYYAPSAAFDNDGTTWWESWSSYGSLQWEFTTLPQVVEQVHLTTPYYMSGGSPIYSSVLLDLKIERSYGGETWETVTTKRGLVEPNSWDTPGNIDLPLTGPVVANDGFIGVNDFGRTDRAIEFCPQNKVAITGYSIPHPVVIERFIAYSRAPLPSPPIGDITYTFKIRGVIYASNVSNVPETLIAVTAERTSVPNDWFELELSEPLVLEPGFYHFGVHVGGTSGGIYSCDTYGPQVSMKTLLDFPFGDGPPDPFPILTSGAVEQSQPHPVYVIYPISTGVAALAALTSQAAGFFGTFQEAVTGTALALLDDLTSAASGARQMLRSPRVPLNGAMVNVSLAGSRRTTLTLAGSRRTVSLSATWVSR